MKKVLAILSVFSAILFYGCSPECDPGTVPVDDFVWLMLKTNTDAPYLNYGNNALPDSVKVTNLATNTVLTTRYLRNDSLLVIEDFNKTNGATTNYKIAKGNFAKADTLSITVATTNVPDNCGNNYPVARFSSLKVNNITMCTGCQTSTKYRYIRP